MRRRTFLEESNRKKSYGNIITATIVGLGEYSVRLLSSLTPIETMYIDGVSKTKAYTYVFNDTKTHTLKFKLKEGYSSFENLFTQSNIDTVDLSDIDSIECTNFRYMFSNCSLLKYVNVNYLTTTNVKDMSSMFTDCVQLETIDGIGKFDTSNVENMGTMFTNCKKLITLDVSKWNTSKVTNLSSIFKNCENLTTLDVSKWDVSNVVSFTDCFRVCNKLNVIDTRLWNTRKAVSMNGMFCACSSCKTFYYTNFDSTNLTNIDQMFCGTYISSVNLSWLNKASNIQTIYGLFDGCLNLTSVDFSMVNLTNCYNFDMLFFNCSYLTSVKLGELSSYYTCNNTFIGVSTSGTIYLPKNASNTSKIVDESGLPLTWKIQRY